MATNEASLSSNEGSDSSNGAVPRKYKKNKDQKYCLICHDKALGYNFNAISCESCKAFFRRNALKNQKQRCLFNGSCKIDVKTRRFCPSCRLRRCYEIGMKKEMILDEKEKKERMEKVAQNRIKRQLLSQDISQLKRLAETQNLLNMTSFNFQSLIPSNSDMSSGGLSSSSNKNIHEDSSNDASPSTSGLIGEFDHGQHSRHGENRQDSGYFMDNVHVKQECFQSCSYSKSDTDADPDTSSVYPLPGQSYNKVGLPLMMEDSNAYPYPYPNKKYTEKEIDFQYRSGDAEDLPRSHFVDSAATVDPHLNKKSPRSGSHSQDYSPSQDNDYRRHSTGSNSQDSNQNQESCQSVNNDECYHDISPHVESQDYTRTERCAQGPSQHLSHGSLQFSAATSSCMDQAKSMSPGCSQEREKPTFHSQISSTLISTTGNESPVSFSPIAVQRERKRSTSPSSCVSVSSFKLDRARLPSEEHCYRKLSLKEVETIENLARQYHETLTVYFVEENLNEDNSYADVDSIVNNSEFAVRRLIKFVKLLSDFKELPLTFQMQSLKSCVWTTILLRSVNFYDAEHNAWKTPTGFIPNEVLKSATGHSNDYLHDVHTCFCRSMKTLIDDDLNIMALLQMIVLFDPDLKDVNDTQVIADLQDKYILLLKHYLETTVGYSCSQQLLPKLLAKIDELKQLSNNHQSEFFPQMNTARIVPLMLEVLKLPF